MMCEQKALRKQLNSKDAAIIEMLNLTSEIGTQQNF
jgi:hypothetical protein